MKTGQDNCIEYVTHSISVAFLLLKKMKIVAKFEENIKTIEKVAKACFFL